MESNHAALPGRTWYLLVQSHPIHPPLLTCWQITLTGFSFVVVNFLTLLWYNPTLDTDCPPWVYASWAIGLFLYQTFDAVDGTQARRTHQSGPLGELFDHSRQFRNLSARL